ncbi:MAG: hypothetical protein EPN75_10695 [Beijerinckiaceae bacterium]|nr:MAG: hypothetical protein EPN75_10695 [Beijerinckiaceae bacterium]
MHYSNLLKGTAIAALLAAGCAFASSASAQGIVVAPYGPAYAAPYAPEYYGDPYGYAADDYVPGPIALGAAIVGGAVDLGLTAATVPFWGDDYYYNDYRAYPSAYGYGYDYAYPRPGYAYERPAYGNPYYDEYTGHRSVQHQARIAHHMNHHYYHAAYHHRPYRHEIVHVRNTHSVTHKVRQAHHLY